MEEQFFNCFHRWGCTVSSRDHLCYSFIFSQAYRIVQELTLITTTGGFLFPLITLVISSDCKVLTLTPLQNHVRLIIRMLQMSSCTATTPEGTTRLRENIFLHFCCYHNCHVSILPCVQNKGLNVHRTLKQNLFGCFSRKCFYGK